MGEGTNGHTPLNEIVDQMMTGDFLTCCEYLRRQRAAAVPTFVIACQALGKIAREVMLRDPAAFMAHKFQDVALDQAVFRRAVEAVMQTKPDQVRAELAQLDLDGVGMVGTLGYRMEGAARFCTPRPPLPQTQLQKNDATQDTALDFFDL